MQSGLRSSGLFICAKASDGKLSTRSLVRFMIFLYFCPIHIHLYYQHF
ncbi:hypothetical protein HMPREF0658_2037 [Hoylesella marshii DSM 16973 = JCM 13450]|uniref:Uncharacterized protein n=1 Tax=Hoylesella marshii DSM 16973 = JCM 13450 TaxID=862515 RepID=E0NV32_9BACT|nr:hypothetical protein HMPREF0658_2037 [Hoylesella marshii DSM 16973 = JCM 13450]